MKESLKKNLEETTVRQRNIVISLSDEDLKKLVNKAGSIGFTVGELLQSFIADLVNGTESYNSSCRSFIEDWYNYSFSHCDDTLLSNLMRNGFENVDGFVDVVFFKEFLSSVLKTKKMPSPFNPNKEVELSNIDLVRYNKDLIDCKTCYERCIYDHLTNYPNADIVSEVEHCKEFINQYYYLMSY